MTLTLAQFCDLIAQPCTYCGDSTGVTGSGLDRLDSSKGYTPDNVTPCCRDCNVAKSDRFTPDEMRVIGQAIADVKRRRKTPAPDAAPAKTPAAA